MSKIVAGVLVAAASASAFHTVPMARGVTMLRQARASAGRPRLLNVGGMSMAGIDMVGDGQYHDSNEVDRTTMEGQVTKVGEKISFNSDVVRGELIDCATVESDVTEAAWQAEYIKAFGVPPPMEKLYDDETQAQMGWYDGEIDRDAELAKAKEQGWLAEGATVGAESDAVIALAKAKENAKKPASGIDDGEEEDNSIQARFMRDRERIRRAGLENSNADIVKQDMQLGTDRRA